METKEICNKYNVILIEDSCESVGTLYNEKQTGTFGLMSSFSTYFGHHYSTIEGGFVCTDDFELYEILKSIRSHGWSRDLCASTKQKLQTQYNIDDYSKRYNNFLLYDKNITNNYWKLKADGFISNFAYPIIHPLKNKIVEQLQKYNVECRPLICGSMSRQPFFYNLYGTKKYSFSDLIHDYGLYLPNNPDITENEIQYICNIVNEITGEI